MEPTHIPFAFVGDRLALSWSDVAWGFRHGWLSAGGVVEYAIGCLPEEYEANSTLAKLASSTQAEVAELPNLLERIVGAEEPKVSSAQSEKRWLYLVLAWIYANRAERTDPLGVVEEIYADFDYPAEIRHFVRYMPPEDGYEPQAHTHAENVTRLFNNWRDYLRSFSEESPDLP